MAMCAKLLRMQKVKFQNTCKFVDRSITKDNLKYLVAAFMLICFYFKLTTSH